MSFISKVTMEQARAAKNSLKEKLAQDFAQAADNPVVGIGLGRISTAEWGVSVNLSREPRPEETQKLPNQYQNVQVRYTVTGPNVAL